jgi:hypothetical protein
MFKKLLDKLSGKAAPDAIIKPRALVAVVAKNDISPLNFIAREDFTILSKNYKNAVFKAFTSPDQFLMHVDQQRYDYVHVILDMDHNWNMTSHEIKTSLNEVVTELVKYGVRWIWIAGQSEKGQLSNTPRGAPSCFYVVTGKRNNFKKFYESLLSKIVAGKTIQQSWTEMVTQQATDDPVSFMAPGKSEIIFRIH